MTEQKTHGEWDLEHVWPPYGRELPAPGIMTQIHSKLAALTAENAALKAARDDAAAAAEHWRARAEAATPLDRLESWAAHGNFTLTDVSDGMARCTLWPWHSRPIYATGATLAEAIDAALAQVAP